MSSGAVAVAVPRVKPSPVGLRSEAVAVVAALLLAVLPVLSLDLPGLIDLPNTIARATIRTQLGSDAFYDLLYRKNSPFVPNAAFDVFYGLVRGVLPPIATGRACATLAILLTVTGVVALARSLGSHVALAALLGAFLAHDYSLTWGFLNYQIAVGLLLWTTCLWLRVRAGRVRARLLAPSALALAMFFCHVVPLALYAVIVAGIEIELWRRDRAKGAVLARALAVAGVQFLAPMLVLLAVSPTSAELLCVDAPVLLDNLRGCAKALHAGLGSAEDLHLGLLAALAALALGLGRVHVSAGTRLPLLLLVVVCLAAPDKTNQASCLQQRLPVVLGFVAAASLCFTTARVGRAGAMLLAVAAALGIRTAALWPAYRDRAALLRDAGDLLAVVPDGALLFTVIGPLTQDDRWTKYRVPLEHAACLRALRGSVFLPQLLVSNLHHTVAPANASVGEFCHLAEVGSEAKTPDELRARARTLVTLYAQGIERGECPPLPGGIWLAAVHYPPHFEFPADALVPVAATQHLRLFRVR